MAETTIKQNSIPNDPQLADLMNQVKKDVMLGLNCHHIGVIQKFDAAKQTATVTIVYKKTYFQLNPATGLYVTVLVDYPILLDCPVIVLGGGATALTFPIAEGDECLILFNDRDIDNWFKSGQPGPVATARLHSFADGIALVGLRSLNNVLEDYDEERAVLRNGSTRVGVGEEKIVIENETTTLNTLLQDLITQLKALVIDVNNVAPGGGVVSAASQLQLTNIATQIEGLLE